MRADGLEPGVYDTRGMDETRYRRWMERSSQHDATSPAEKGRPSGECDGQSPATSSAHGNGTLVCAASINTRINTVICQPDVVSSRKTGPLAQSRP